MEIAVKESLNQSKSGKQRTSRWFTNWKFLIPVIIVVIALIISALSYYRATHFNTNVTINGIKVGGLTAEDALQQLKATVLKNEVYIGDQLIYNGKDTNSGFSGKDLASIENILNKQQTFLPSSKKQDFALIPSQLDQTRIQEMKTEMETKLTEMNKDLTPPQDAQVRLENGKIIIENSVDGKQYDVATLMNQYEKQKYSSEIHLEPTFIEAIKEDSELIEIEKGKLQELLQHTVQYKVQDKVHALKGSDLIKNATISKDLTVTIDTENINNKISEINHSQSTLNKDFSFKSNSGKVITVKGQGYGWALDVEKEASQIDKAFANGETTLSASNTYGHGWSGEGYGYGVTKNGGIGDTYAEVSLAEQRMWIYRDGQLVFTTHVVTGNHNTGEETSEGVWYVLYKRTPYELTGSRVGGSPYAIEVNYWVPFTNSGQGFHDASWRTNWSGNAYISDGSGGCVNVEPGLMKKVYENLNVYDPVVVY
ncbi:L,D-transpeptidase family protein [Niallia sp. XMNu-256]|uniref:L,D-transpeptidase family protein n=1 Tax=Niallia sp. XMNu-256 TaxID=3082444 RepID=UPI0030CE7174